MVNPEAIIADDPDVIVGTGANWIESKADSTAVPLGYDATPEIVAQRLKALSQRPVFTQLKAVRNRRMHVIYHQFYTSPYHLVALQVMAKWFQPELFRELDPAATFRTLHERFVPIPQGGIFWATLGA
jgi:iron complex transport system substrate-binding protein